MLTALVVTAAAAVPTATAMPTATAVLATTAMPAAGSAARLGSPGHVGATAPTSSEIVVSMRGLNPTVARADTPVQVRLDVTNRSAQTLEGVDVILHLGRSALVTRSELDTWEVDAAGVGSTLPTVARQRLDSLAAGATARVTLTVTSPALPTRSFGTLPLAVEARTAGVSTWSRTFLPFYVRKQFVPLRLAVAVPLTLDPDAYLVSTTAAERDRAWAKAIGPGSRIDRLLTGGASSLVTWAVDPALVGAAPSIASSEGSPTAPSSAPSPSMSASTSASTSGTPSAGATSAGATPSGAPVAPSRSGAPRSSGTPSTSSTSSTSSTPTRTLQAALRDRLSQARVTHPLWRLPTGDPDVLGLVNARATTALTGSLLGTDDLGTSLDGTVNAVGWPVGGGLSEEQARTLDAGYGESGHPTAYLAPLTSLGDNPANITTAPRRTVGGLPVLAYDDRLSALLAATTAVRDAAKATARFLAETAVVLEQQPGRSRSVLVVAPRTYAPDPAALSSLLAAVAAAPWLEMTSTAALESEAAATTITVPSQSVTGHPTASATAMAPGAIAPGAIAPSTQASPQPSNQNSNQNSTTPPTATLVTPPSALTPADVSAVESGLGQLNGLATATSTGASYLTSARARTLALTSTRWRGANRERTTLARSVADQLSALRASVHVVESTVNFFADTGILQVTVVNDLPVAVHDITLRLNPDDRVSRLRILEQPGALRIRAGSRTTVRVPVEAIAAGLVPVSTRLQTPAGTTLGTDGTVRVQVQPTNGWVMLALGGVALVVFLAGLYRALRAGRPRISPSELKEIDLS